MLRGGFGRPSVALPNAMGSAPAPASDIESSKDEMLGEGRALPWADGMAFVQRIIALALADLALADAKSGWVFFDRGLLDALAALQHLTGQPALAVISQKHRFHRCVFLAPPWSEIYVTDTERRHSFDTAVAEY